MTLDDKPLRINSIVESGNSNEKNMPID